MTRIPRRLKNDPIVEALFELRFTSTDIAEVILGKLASCEEWRNSGIQRLPLADVPAAIRENDPNLAYQPVLQVNHREGTRLIKIGPRMLSYHALPPYPGWPVFEPELWSSTQHVFGVLKDVIATRFGFRYINLLTKEHLIEGISSLNIDVRLAGDMLTSPLNLNYQRSRAAKHNSIVRVASIEFVQNPSPGLTALVDVDIFTPTDFRSNDAAEARVWIDEAHKFLKEEFFTLLPDSIIDQLEER
jgi:uncharacterized protein (TIGR04255 family)